MLNDATPLSLAKSLAYLGNASTIRARVKDHFGVQLDLAKIEAILEARKPKPVRLEFDECGHKRDEANTLWDGASAVCRRCHNARKRALERWKRSKEKKEREEVRAAAVIYEEAVKPSLANIVRAACIIGNCTEAQLTGKARHKWIVEVRWVVCLLSLKYGFSSPACGRAMSRDHSSILNGIKGGRYLMENDPGFAAMVSKVESKLAQLTRKAKVTVSYDMAKAA